jgi:hypothetical protein
MSGFRGSWSSLWRIIWRGWLRLGGVVQGEYDKFGNTIYLLRVVFGMAKTLNKALVEQA